MSIELSAQYKRLADNCLRLAEFEVDEHNRRRYLRMADAWLALAEGQEWLQGHPPEILSARPLEQTHETQ